MQSCEIQIKFMLNVWSSLSSRSNILFPKWDTEITNKNCVKVCQGSIYSVTEVFENITTTQFDGHYVNCGLHFGSSAMKCECHLLLHHVQQSKNMIPFMVFTDRCIFKVHMHITSKLN